MKITKINFWLILLLTIFLAQIILIQTILPVQAAESALWEMQEGKTEIGGKFGGETPLDIRLIAARIVKIFIGFLGIIFVFLIVFAGFKWMMAGGNEEKINEAKDQIKTGIIGLIIIFAAYSITSYLTDCILDITTGSTSWMCKP